MDYKVELEKLLNNDVFGTSYLAAKLESILPFVPRQEFDDTVKKIITTHASAASVINKANYLCLKREGKDITAPAEFTSRTFDKFWWENRQRKSWVTLSLSRWVVELVKHSSWRLKIKVGISYPGQEGMALVEKIKSYHQVSVYEDAKLVSEVGDSDGVIMGAVHLSDGAVTGKIGSLSLAIAAHYFKKPCYIISSGDKYLTGELQPF